MDIICCLWIYWWGFVVQSLVSRYIVFFLRLHWFLSTLFVKIASVSFLSLKNWCAHTLLIWFFWAICWFLVLDRVFSHDCTTRKVYEEGVKEVALSAVSGINCEHACLLLYQFYELCLEFHQLNFTSTYFQQVFLLMGKQAVERRTQWLQSLSTAWQIYMTT